MAKSKKKKRERRGKQYKPLLSLSDKMRQREEWERNQVRTTPLQNKRIGEILRKADEQRIDIDRFTWLGYHERLENEVGDRVYNDPILKGMRIAIEWKLHFFADVHRRMVRVHIDDQMEGPPPKPFLDQMIPTPEFCAASMFDGIEMFQPRVVILQHERQADFLESAEESIYNSTKRREAGGAYFTDVQRLMSHMPSEGGEMDPLRPGAN